MSANERLKNNINQAIIATSDVYSAPGDLAPHHNDLILFCIVSGYTDGTYTATLQHSPDGVVWEDVASCAGLAAAGMATKVISTQTFNKVSLKMAAAAIALGGATSVQVGLAYSTKK